MKHLIANWKMYVDTRGGVALARELLRICRGRDVLPDIIVCPSFPALSEMQKALARSRVRLGAQDAFWANDGAHTGEVGPQVLKDLGVSAVIVGHSERRRELGETDAMVAKKCEAVLGAGLTAILCVGEDRAERAAGQTREVVERQLHLGLANVTARDSIRLFIAYEPVWAISGSGNAEPASVEDVVMALVHIRETLAAMFGPSAAAIPLLYGGSVSGENAYTYLREDCVDGILLGGASVKVHQLSEIVEAALRAMKGGTAL